MLAETQVGPKVAGDGTYQPARSTKDGSIAVQDAHARFQEAVMRGNVFCAANTANQALSVNSATATGLILTNPAGSGKNLVLLELAVAITVAPTAVGSVVLEANINPVAAAVTHTTPITPRNALLGTGTAPAGLVDSAATLPAAPIVIRSIMGIQWVTGAQIANLAVKDLVDGAVILAPGTAVSIQAITTAVTGVMSFTWEEIPI